MTLLNHDTNTKEVVGPVGVEPTTFSRNSSHTVPMGFSSLQNLVIPEWSVNPCMFLEPLTVDTVTFRFDYRHPFPAPIKRLGVARLRPLQQHFTCSKYIHFLKNKRNINEPRHMKIGGLPAIGRGTHLIPSRTQKLNHAPFMVLVWSSAT